MKQIGIGLLGFGRIGKIHFRNIMHYFSNAKMVAVADPQVACCRFYSEIQQRVFFEQ
ncbi:hypothetical protein [Phnomibacter ginsenosidimutans]|uniref:Gfo/Idh/MocA-like oxidoreductase N-terminal domain-containing protein n=1 Tax=Phnomibacter ginsenosidimutans TaxID=2676868 RepID=A0A6I6GDF4_9BACT|nr:hypothetical protein [Phnomibacter ginsenosidimutans]QGW28350.1 hypothetical protein GLV81_09835 [Phnomibacter ginsenosidimutans]